jgi:hypothetical protein
MKIIMKRSRRELIQGLIKASSVTAVSLGSPAYPLDFIQLCAHEILASPSVVRIRVPLQKEP